MLVNLTQLISDIVFYYYKLIYNLFQRNIGIIYFVFILIIYPLIFVAIAMTFSDYMYQHYSALQEIEDYQNFCLVMESLQSYNQNQVDLQFEVEGLREDLLNYELAVRQIDWLKVIETTFLVTMSVLALYIIMRQGYIYFYGEPSVSIASSIISNTEPNPNADIFVHGTKQLAKRLERMHALVESNLQQEIVLANPHLLNNYKEFLLQIEIIQQNLGSVSTLQILEPIKDLTYNIETFINFYGLSIENFAQSVDKCCDEATKKGWSLECFQAMEYAITPNSSCTVENWLQVYKNFQTKS